MTEKKPAPVQLIIRVPKKIKAALAKYAADEDRSLNAQAVVFVKDGLRKVGYLKDKK